MSVGYNINEDEFEKYLNINGMSMQPKYMLDKGIDFKRVYHVDEVFNNKNIIPQEVIAKSISRKTRKNNKK